MQRYWLMAVVAGILLAGLGVGLAASAPPLLPPSQYLENLERYITVADGHIEAEYVDCTLGFEHSKFDHTGSTNIGLDCGFTAGSGGGRSGSVEEHPSLLAYEHDYVDWERYGIESCTLQTNSQVRAAESGPNTLLITINCWWYDDTKETVVLNSTLTDRQLRSLIHEASHVILGVVTQVNPVQVAAEGDQAVFTDVVIAVNEDMKGTYQDTLITIWIEGGETDQLLVINEDAPEFKVGERVVVFVKELDGVHGGNYTLEGLSQGKYGLGPYDRAENKDPTKHTSLDELRAMVEAALAGDE